MGNKYKLLKKILLWTSAVAVVYMILVYLWASAYSVLSADDFSHGVSFAHYKESNHLHIISAVAFSVGIYLSWQGTFFTMFIQALLSPVNGFGFSQLRVVMLINALLIMVSILVLIYELFGNLSKELSFMALVAGAVVLFALFGSVAYYEVFFWYSGSTSYGFPFSMLVLGLIFLLRYYRLKEKKYARLSKILGFLACGGTLMIAGAGCYLSLLIVLYNSLKNKKVDKKGWSIFVWWVIGALINVAGPGNYKRKSTYGTGLQIGAAVKNSVLICIRNFKSLVKQGYLFEVAVIFLIMGIVIGTVFIKGSIDRRSRVLSLVTATLSPVASWFACFPATLGYNAEWGLNNRCDFVLNNVIVGTILFATVVVGIELAVMAGRASRLAIPVLVVAAVIGSIVLPQSVIDNKYSEITRQLVNGEIQEYYTTCVNFFDMLESFPEGTDVKLSMNDMPKPVDNTMDIYYYEAPSDPENWMNKALAEYYGLNSFVID